MKNRPASEHRQFLTFLGATFLILALTGAVSALRGLPLLPEGPALQQARSAISLWKHSSFEAPEYRSLHKRLLNLSARTGEAYWQDVYTLSRVGELLPKHSLLLPLIAAPFYGLLGTAGFWLLNSFIFLALFAALWFLVHALGLNTGALLLLCLPLIGTQVFLESYGLSLDLFGTTLIICGFALMRRYSLSGGAILGLSLFVRPSYVLLFPFLLVAWRNRPEFSLHQAIFGLVTALLAYFSLNYVMYGSFWSLAYNHIPAYAVGALVPYNHPIGFNYTVLLSDWGEKLWSVKVGAFLFNPVIPLAVFSLPLLFNSPNRRLYAALFSGSLVYSLYIFSYEMWSFSPFGNRFLLSVALLLALPLFEAMQIISAAKTANKG